MTRVRKRPFAPLLGLALACASCAGAATNTPRARDTAAPTSATSTSQGGRTTQHEPPAASKKPSGAGPAPNSAESQPPPSERELRLLLQPALDAFYSDPGVPFRILSVHSMSLSGKRLLVVPLAVYQGSHFKLAVVAPATNQATLVVDLDPARCVNMRLVSHADLNRDGAPDFTFDLTVQAPYGPETGSFIVVYLSNTLDASYCHAARMSELVTSYARPPVDEASVLAAVAKAIQSEGESVFACPTN